MIHKFKLKHMSKTYFISGHTDLSHKEFLKYYQEKIDQAINENANFVIGDATGVDLFAQNYIASKNVDRTKIIIYHLFDKPKNNPNNYPTQGGFKTHNEKDAAMTKNSNEDILWFRSADESKLFYGDKYNPKRISGTETNHIRRTICK